MSVAIEQAMVKEKIIERLSKTPFIPHPALRNPHAQTIAGTLIPRRPGMAAKSAERRLFDVSADAQVLALCSWQSDPRRSPTLLIAHGMEGSVDSRYMLGTAEKALEAGFNAIRVNFRNCGGTEHLTPTLYHAGLTDDLRHIIGELIEKDRLDEIYLAGFSLGGNVALKLAGEYGSAAPAQMKGIVAVSPSIDLAACADAIEMRSNTIYHLRFIFSLRNRMRRKARLFPDRYDASLLRRIWSIREFDDTYTAPHAGFRGVAHYYERASALRVIDRIELPTLIIHAKDDPFIPFSQFNSAELTGNPNIALLAPERGGHVGFIRGDAEGEARFWAEVMAVEFLKLMVERE
jgi:predicted alpha/beta-fold hydrolase